MQMAIASMQIPEEIHLKSKFCLHISFYLIVMIYTKNNSTYIFKKNNPNTFLSNDFNYTHTQSVPKFIRS